MGHNSVVSGYPKSTSFLQVDDWSTDPRVLGHHRILILANINQFRTDRNYIFKIVAFSFLQIRLLKALFKVEVYFFISHLESKLSFLYINQGCSSGKKWPT